MKLIRIELQGFKSFRDRTQIAFTESGINAILGPNGCGKSNLVDALKWGLGDQSAKSLRGSSMQDIIFGGTLTSKPVSLAQVSLIFSNTGQHALRKYGEFKEIQVTRRYYRNGESLYMLNNSPCRLMDIKEIFLDTGIGGKGYSIIEQGKISQIVTAKPDEIRAMIDEAAGIMKFKTKKAEAERKLTHTRQNLLRICDMQTQLKEQFEKLETQVNRLREFRNLQQEILSLQKKNYAFKWLKLKNDGEQLLNHREKNLENRQFLQNEIGIAEADLQNMDIAQLSLSRALEELGKEIGNFSQDIRDLENSIQLDRQSLANLLEWESKEQSDGQKQGEKLARLSESIRLNQDEREKTRISLTELKKQIALAEEKKGYLENRLEEQNETQADLSRQETRIKDEIHQLFTQLKLTEEKLNASRSQEEIPNYLETRLEDEIGILEKRIAELTAEGEASRQIIQDHLQKIEECGENLTTLKELWKNANQRCLELKGEVHLAEREAEKLLSEEKLMKKAGASAKKLLDYFVESPQTAMECTFLGAFLDLLELGENTPPPLAHEMLGFNSLLVFEKLASFPAVNRLVENLDLLDVECLFLDAFTESPSLPDWVADTTHPSLAGFLEGFAQTGSPVPEAGFPNLRGRIKLFGKDFTVLPPGLVRIRPKLAQEEVAGLGLRRRIQENAELLEKLREDDEAAKASVEEHGGRVESLEEELEEYETMRTNAEQDLLSVKREREYLEKQLEGKKADHKVLLEKKNQSAAVEGLPEKIEETKAALKSLDEKMRDLQANRNRETEEAGETKTALEQTKEDIQTFRLSAKDLENRLQYADEQHGRLTKENRDIQEELDKNKGSSQKNQAGIDDFRSKIRGNEKRLHETLPALEDKRKHYALKKNEVEQIQNRKMELQAKLKNLERDVQRLADGDQGFQISLAKIGQESNSIEEVLSQDYQCTPNEVLKTFEPFDFEPKKAEFKLKEAKEKLASITNVNLGADQEHAEVKSKLDFLTEQRTDLEESSDSLSSSIGEMDLHSVEYFSKALGEINRNFQRVFPLLFNGGEASLVLLQPENLLESGLDITAKPPGKRLQSLSLMSGGEKAMTALALVFAIFFTKPSPICVLDEVDAPLDDANVGRFSRMLENLKEDCQFIVITHNKKTMEHADRMFGITMEEPGISRIVSVDFESIQKMKIAG